MAKKLFAADYPIIPLRKHYRSSTRDDATIAALETASIDCLRRVLRPLHCCCWHPRRRSGWDPRSHSSPGRSGGSAARFGLAAANSGRCDCADCGVRCAAAAAAVACGARCSWVAEASACCSQDCFPGSGDQFDSGGELSAVACSATRPVAVGGAAAAVAAEEGPSRAGFVGRSAGVADAAMGTELVARWAFVVAFAGNPCLGTRSLSLGHTQSINLSSSDHPMEASLSSN